LSIFSDRAVVIGGRRGALFIVIPLKAGEGCFDFFGAASCRESCSQSLRGSRQVGAGIPGVLVS